MSGLNTRLSTLVVRFMRVLSGALAAAGSGRPFSIGLCSLHKRAHQSKANISVETSRSVHGI